MKSRNTEYIFFLGLFLLSLLTWDDISNIINFTRPLKIFLYLFTICCFAINILSCKYKKKEIFIMSILMLMILYSTYKMQEVNIFMDFFAIIASKNVSNRKIVRVLLYINLIFVLFHIFSTAIGIVANKKIYETFIGEIRRESLGMRHPNYAAATIFWTLSGYLYLNENKSRIYTISLITIVTIISYFSTYSRTTLILYIFMILLVAIRNKKIQSFIIRKSKYIVVPLIILSIILAYRYNTLPSNMNTIKYKLNNILSNRLQLNALAIKVYGLTLFGQNIFNVNHEIFALDSFYISCWVNYGIIHLLILLALYIKYSNKTKKYYDYIFLLLELIVAFIERYNIYITIVFPLFFLKELLITEETETETEKEKNLSSNYVGEF